MIAPLTLIALVLIMLDMGLRFRFDGVIAAARALRIALLAILVNYALIPAVTLALLGLARPDPRVALGFLTLAVCPGAPLGPPITGLARGDVPRAIGLMLILAGLSVFLSPLLLGLLAARAGGDETLVVDPLAIVRVLLMTQLVPLFTGLGLHAYAPAAAAKLARPVHGLASGLFVLLVVCLVIAQRVELATIRPRGWLWMALLLLASLAFGWLCGGPSATGRKTLAVTSTTRNAAVALAIVTASFPGTPAVTAVVAYALVSTLGAVLFAYLIRPFAHLEDEPAGPSHGDPDLHAQFPNAP